MKIIKLFVGLVSAFLLMTAISCNQCPHETCTMMRPDSTGTHISIAFVKMDSLLLNYNVYKQMSEELLQEEEKSRLSLNQKATALQKEVEEFQNKVQHNAFLTQERALSEQERLIKKQKDLQELGIKLEQELLVKQQKMTEKLNLVIDSVINAYNVEADHDFIITNTGKDNLLFGNQKYNITSKILEILNAEK
ncbi:MAG: OmpH family outer membrane protein [Paludibacteraceae bacterium]|nr:OmpH family outer membrane protein [Paludibacteraceae bacterium]